MLTEAAYSLPPLASWRTRCALALVVGASFGIVGHSLDRSQRLVEERGVLASTLENPYAAQQEDTTLRTALAFFMLGGAGVICLAMRPLGQLSWQHPVIALGALFIAWCCFSLLWSENPEISVRKIGILVLMVVGAFGMAHQLELEDVCWVAVLTLGTYLGLGFLMELRYGTFRPWEGPYRFAGTVHPNDQGVMSSVLVLAAASAPWHTTGKLWLRNTLLGSGLAAAWISGSRTAVAALGASFIVAVLLRQRGTNRALAFAAAAGVVSLGAIVYGFANAGAVHSASDAAAMGRAGEVSTLSGRLPLWDAVLHDAAKHPLVGYGYGGYWSVKRMLDISQQLGWHIPHCHNGYLELFVSVGAIGLVLYLTWAVASAATALLRFQGSNRPAELFLACLVVFGFVNAAAESKFPESSVGTYIMYMAMASMGLRHARPRRLAEPSLSAARPWRLPARHALTP